MGYLMPRTREELASCCEGGIEDIFNTLCSLPGYSQIVPVDVTANDDTVNITADLPGLDKDKIKIEYLDGRLTQSGGLREAALLRQTATPQRMRHLRQVMEREEYIGTGLA